MSHQPDHIYEFGPFCLDVAERMLMRAGEAIPLQPKAFDLLHVLVEHQGHLLEKDELLKVVWPDTIVEEVNLANNISVLRKALDEDGNGQRFIETVPRRGYRFVAKVSQIQSAPVEEEPPIAIPVAEPLSRSGPWRRLALVPWLVPGALSPQPFCRSKRRDRASAAAEDGSPGFSCHPVSDRFHRGRHSGNATAD